MPKPSLIEDKSFLVDGLCIVGATIDENDRIGAIGVDGVTVSFSVSDGPGLNPMQIVDLLVAVEAISSRYSDPWFLPAAVHLEKLPSGYWVDSMHADGVTDLNSVLFANKQIASLADFVLSEDVYRKINLLVGEDRHHRKFHTFQDRIRECKPEA